MGVDPALRESARVEPLILQRLGRMLGVHHPVAVLEVRAGAPRIGGGVGQQGAQERIRDILPLVELRVALGQERRGAGYGGAGHAGAVHGAVAVGRHGAEHVLALGADGGEHAPVGLGPPAAEVGHVTVAVDRAHVDGVLGAVAGGEVAGLAVELLELASAGGLVVARGEDVLEGGVAVREQVEVVVRGAVDDLLELGAGVGQVDAVGVLGEGDVEPLLGDGHLLLGAEAVLLGVEVVGVGVGGRRHAAGVGVQEPRAQDGAGDVGAVGVVVLVLLHVHPIPEVHVLGDAGVPDADPHPAALQAAAAQGCRRVEHAGAPDDAPLTVEEAGRQGDEVHRQHPGQAGHPLGCR